MLVDLGVYLILGGGDSGGWNCSKLMYFGVKEEHVFSIRVTPSHLIQSDVTGE